MLQLQSEVSNIASRSFLSNNISLSFICEEGFDFTMSHEISSDRLVFTLYDKTKPLLYSALEFSDDHSEAKIITKNNRPIRIEFDYPYYEEVVPQKIIPTKYFFFTPIEFKLQDKQVNKKPDFKEVERLIFKALNKLKSKILWNQY